MSAFQDFCKSTVIVMATHNRRNVTEICLKNIELTKKQATLLVVDDFSTELSTDDLRAWAPTAVIQRPPHKMGIEKLRIHAHNALLGTPYKYVYHTDNDAYHDPGWLYRLFDIYQRFQGLCGLYNTKHHFSSTITEVDDIVIRRSCPGISFFYEVKKLPKIDAHYNSWDYVFGDKLQPAAISKVSYVEHFGAGGIHNRDFDRDRAHNPTPWLLAERERIIKLLTTTG